MQEKIIEIVSDKVEATVLGQRVSAPLTYCPEILVKVPRIENREQYNINEDSLPFDGYDVWNCYEISFLTNSGYPIYVTGKIIYSCRSKYIVESKSLKLYLNSLNMYRAGNSTNESIRFINEVVVNDLSKLLETEVQFMMFDVSVKPVGIEPLDVVNYTNLGYLFNNRKYTKFNEAPEVLHIREFENRDIVNKFYIPFLRSNCKITNQPDWGTVFIDISGDKHSVDDIVEYIISFRNENHFHEECCEMIYKRLLDAYSPDSLMVACLYTRRGGIDINPVRYSLNYDTSKLNILDIYNECYKTSAQ